MPLPDNATRQVLTCRKDEAEVQRPPVGQWSLVDWNPGLLSPTLVLVIHIQSFLLASQG